MTNPFKVGTAEFGHPAAGGYYTISRMLTDYIRDIYKAPVRVFNIYGSHNLHSD